MIWTIKILVVVNGVSYDIELRTASETECETIDPGATGLIYCQRVGEV